MFDTAYRNNHALLRVLTFFHSRTFFNIITQLTFSFRSQQVDALEKGVKYVQNYQ